MTLISINQAMKITGLKFRPIFLFLRKNKIDIFGQPVDHQFYDSDMIFCEIVINNARFDEFIELNSDREVKL